MNRIYLKIRKILLKISNYFFINGLDIGSGENYSELFFEGIDQVDGFYINQNTTLPFKDNSIKYIYISHFIEHIDNSTFDNITKECSRILENGGTIRIIYPNFELIKFIYDNNLDLKKYKLELINRPEWINYNIESNIHNWILHWFANYQNCPYIESPEFKNPNVNFYRGPPKLDSNLVKSKSKELNLFDFSSWIISKIPKEYLQNGGHINCYNSEKIQSYALKYNLTYMEGSYAKSNIKKFNYFDKKLNRRYISSYCELIKDAK